MTILKINDLALQLVANDFKAGHIPTNGGPTKTSRALAIIHLAAHDAYAAVTGQFMSKLTSLPSLPIGIGNDEATGTSALLGAGIHAAEQLYPDDTAFIISETAGDVASSNPVAFNYGKQVADAWLAARSTDQSTLPQTDDDKFSNLPGRHRPDPLNSKQFALGRNWGKVTPFILGNVVTDAPLAPPPALTSLKYAEAFDQVITAGKSDVVMRDPDFRYQAAVGIFWGYDGTNLLGTPPRLYNQVVRKIQEFKDLPHSQQVRILTAINVAMADAGIAAWHWKYEYDVWRPVVGIREADPGFGPTGSGDGNTLRKKGDPFWLPLGAPNSNPVPPKELKELKLLAASSNGTPPFPAYPSGHSTFGSACFEVAAALLCKKTEEISVTFVSDEFNDMTTDNTGATRPRWEQTFTLRQAIDQNAISRIYLGVHWDFDASGGETVGNAVAVKVVEAFR
jgi:PAP2 superfamily